MVAIGLGALEWWAVNELYGTDRFGGPILGASFVAALVSLPYFQTKFDGHWASAGIAALTAVVELLFCVAALGSLSAIAVLLLPLSITTQFMQGDSATDFIIFLMLSLGLVIAARGWVKYSTQSLLASKAQVEAERARAQVAERDRELARSELTVLRAQVEPHFLWNTLAHVQYLTRKSPDDAEKMTGHLIRFLRSAVPQTRGGMTTLGSEFESVRAYLELMKIRMGVRLTVLIELDPALSDIPFPPLLIQTLVENAIKHGIEPKTGPVTLTVNAAPLQGNPQRIEITVSDNGIGLQAAPATQGTGLGLRSVRDRLRLLYGPGATLSVSGAPAGGVVSRIEVPFQGEEP
jgi:sensor histidine kinase YesM